MRWRHLFVSTLTAINHAGLWNVNRDSKFVLSQQGACQYNPSNSVATCNGWVDIPSGNEQALQQAVAMAGPVAVAIDASSPWFQVCYCC